MKFKTFALAALALALPLLAGAQEAAIRKNLAERLERLDKIDEVRKAPMPGLYEVRVGADIFYTDAQGDYLIHGSLIDTRAKKDLTQERVDKLTAIKFDDLDPKNAIAIVRGNGKRRMAIFEDPNCGYCKHLEQDLQAVDNVTVLVYLLPVLGADSLAKTRQIWCAPDRTKAWLDWMVHGTAPAGNPICNTEAIDANLAFARKYRITGTPAIVFADGTRVPGAIKTAQIEQMLSKAP
ncbi:MAG: DsbC family protein [Burkholderiaceae bacterium]|jgi:thiol:disulfide interchange protein DsbC|nr:DsbC family protein [Burkholderiaceae bacterium]